MAADHQIAVAVVAQPSHTGVGGDTAVHHHQGADRRLQCFEHPGQRPVFPDVAGEDFRAAHEAASIEHQAQGQQRAVAALLFRVPALRLRLVARLALEVGVGQVVERHRRLQVEQPHRVVEQMRLDRLAMLHQHVDRAVEDERLLPAQKEFALNAIQAHDDGIVAGIAAFEAAYPAETAGVDTNALRQRIAPTGAPRKRPAAAPAFRMPAESQAQQPTDESLQLHARVLEHAQAGGKTYRDSVLELAAQGLSASALNAAPDGAQLATAQARVIDPILTTAARGYRNAEHVHKALFPRVETGVRGGTRVEFDRTDFRRSNSSRAPGAKTRRVQFGHDGVKFALAQHRLEGKLPVENAEEAMRVPGIDLGMRTVDGTLALISLEREIHAAELVADQANYPAAHVNALVGGSKWDAAGSAPTKDVAAAIEQVRSAIGRRPKTVLMGPSVFNIVSRHDKVLDNLRWGGERKDHATMEDLARLWNVAEVVVGDAIYVDANDETHDVWGSIVVVAYTMVGAVTRFEPSFGFGYTLSGTPMVEAPYYDRNENSWLYPCCEEWSNEIVGQDAGFLITDVITP